MRTVEVVSNDRSNTVAVIYESRYPSVWMVRRWKRGLLVKRLVSSEWFLDRAQAMEHAERLKARNQSA